MRKGVKIQCVAKKNNNAVVGEVLCVIDTLGMSVILYYNEAFVFFLFEVFEIVSKYVIIGT